jgi:5-formyltetrahydrofolate cyclo-ligase
LHYRRLLDQQVYDHRNQRLLDRIKRLINQFDVRSIHRFLAIAKNREPDFSPLLQWLWGQNISVIASKTDFAAKMLTHHPIREDTPIVVSDKGIPEPDTRESASLENLEIIFVPLLLFDKEGHRIGYGGGYYDRLLSTLPQQTRKVGISLSPGVEKFSFVDSHDVALDCIVTPFETIHCHED